MHHICAPDCPCRMDLKAAADALAESSRLLSESIGGGLDEVIEARFALVSSARSRFYGAMTAYLEHLQKPTLNHGHI